MCDEGEDINYHNDVISSHGRQVEENLFRDLSKEKLFMVKNMNFVIIVLHTCVIFYKNASQ